MKEILDLEMTRNDIQAKTVKDYLKALLIGVWEEEEDFSGKRPFGNSGWKISIYRTLAKHGIIAGKLDNDGNVTSVDFDEYDKADKLISEAIKSL